MAWSMYFIFRDLDPWEGRPMQENLGLVCWRRLGPYAGNRLHAYIVMKVEQLRAPMYYEQYMHLIKLKDACIMQTCLD